MSDVAEPTQAAPSRLSADPADLTSGHEGHLKDAPPRGPLRYPGDVQLEPPPSRLAPVCRIRHTQMTRAGSRFSRSEGRPLVILAGSIRTPPMSVEARR